MIISKTIEDARALDRQELVDSIGGLSNGHYARFPSAFDALVRGPS